MDGRCVHDVSGCGRCACCIFPGKSHNRLRQDDLSSSPVYAMGKTPSQNQSLRKTRAIGELSIIILIFVHYVNYVQCVHVAPNQLNS